MIKLQLNLTEKEHSLLMGCIGFKLSDVSKFYNETKEENREYVADYLNRIKDLERLIISVSNDE